MKSEKTIKKLEAEITELKRMENALQKSEEAYRSLFENNSVAIAIFETDTTISMVNEKYCELSGYNKQEVIGMKWTEQLPPAELERLKEFNRKRLIESKNAPREYEFQFLRKDGEMRFATISIVMLNQKIVASFVDITERRRTEKALKESEEKFLQAFQTAPYAITITCPETEKFLEINESFLTISGYSREDLSTQSSISLQMWVKEADRENVVLTLKEGREVIKKEIFFRRKNGNVFLGSFSAKIIKIMEKPYVLSSINDVSERELTKARLQESEEKYRRLVNNSHDIIYTLTAEGILNFVSPSWTELLGHPVEEVMGQSFQKFVHPEDLSKCVEFLKKVIATGQKQSDAEYRVKHISGEWRWHTTNAVPKHNEAGKIIGFYGIARDITENKQMGKALIESERLKVIGELSSGVAHDFNNILQVIFGNVELGLLLPDAPKEALKYFKAIKEATTDGASRVRQLQRFTSKERTNDRQALDLCALLEEIVLQTKPLWKDEAEKKGLWRNRAC